MQGYVPGPDGAFAQSRKCFAELEDVAGVGGGGGAAAR